MQVAEERDRAAVLAHRVKDAHLLGLGDPFRLDALAALVDQAEILAVDLVVDGVLAREHGVGPRAGCDQHRARRQCHGNVVALAETHGFREPLQVDLDFFGAEFLGEADAFLERLLALPRG